MKSSKIVGENVRGFRERQGYTQAEFARQAGLHRDYVGGIERGERNISIDTLFHVAEVLGVPPNVLLVEGAYKWGNKPSKKFGQ